MNPLSHASRSARRGVKNFRNCQLKTVNTTTSKAASVALFTTKAELVTCPQMEDDGSGKITLPSRDLYTPERSVKNAQKRLERVCGASICANCVYVGLETPVQVSVYRTEVTDAKRVAIEAQLELAQATLALKAVEGQLPVANPQV